jgi:polysaccharide export outer membrane protein
MDSTKLTRSHLAALLIILFTISCTTTKNVPYFQDVSMADSSKIPDIASFHEPTIQPDDILSISIFTIDPATSMVVNQLGSQSLGGLLSRQLGLILQQAGSW